jgi:hypothetical protein
LGRFPDQIEGDRRQAETVDPGRIRARQSDHQYARLVRVGQHQKSGRGTLSIDSIVTDYCDRTIEQQLEFHTSQALGSVNDYFHGNFSPGRRGCFPKLRLLLPNP